LNYSDQNCVRRSGPSSNEPERQASGYYAKHFVAVTPPGFVNDAENRRRWMERVIAAAKNLSTWRFLPSFEFSGDLTVLDGDVIVGGLDRYLLNSDIAGYLGKYIFTALQDVANDNESIAEIFENETNRENARVIFATFWNSWQ
jgi:hypothetical protein